PPMGKWSYSAPSKRFKQLMPDALGSCAFRRSFRTPPSESWLNETGRIRWPAKRKELEDVKHQHQVKANGLELGEHPVLKVPRAWARRRIRNPNQQGTAHA